MKKILITTLLIIGPCVTVNSSETILKLVTDKIGKPGDVLEPGIKERQERLEHLKKEKVQFENSKDAFNAELQIKTTEIEKRVSSVKEGLKINPDDDFLDKSQSLLNDWYQILKDQQKIRESIVTGIDQRIKELELYLKDPNFEGYKRELQSSEITGHSFENLQKLNEKIVDLKKKVDQLVIEEKDAAGELDIKKRTLSDVQEKYKKKKEELAAVRLDSSISEGSGLTPRQRGELLLLEEQILKDKTLLVEMQIKDIEQKRAIVSSSITQARAKLEILNNIVTKRESSITVSELDVHIAKDNLKKIKKHAESVIASLSREIEQYDLKESLLQEISRKYHIALGADLDEWKKEPAKTLEGYVALFEVGLVNDQALLAKRERDLLEARKIVELEQLSQESLSVDVLETYDRITAHKYKSEKERADELKKYQGMKDEAQAKSAEITNKRKTFVNMVEAQKKAVELVHMRERELRKQKDMLFKAFPHSYSRSADMLHEIQILIKKQIKTIEETIALYDSVLTKLNIKTSQINYILDKLENIKWYRSEYAITWKDLKGVSSDISRFSRDVTTWASRVKLRAIVHTMTSMVSEPYGLFFFLLRLLAFILIIILIINWLPLVASWFLSLGRQYRGLKTISYIFSMATNFIIRHWILLSLWSFLLIMGKIYIIPDRYLYVMFFLASIPLFLYLAHQFINYFKEFNEHHHYALVNRQFQERFASILSIILYATPTILLFREAFIVINDFKSELPIILLALNVIIVQISLILMLDKQQLLSAIPTHSNLGEWIYKQVDTYFNLIMFAIVTLIILSNPYVGFGRYIIAIILRIIATAVIIQGLIVLHNFLKKCSISFFFHSKTKSYVNVFHTLKPGMASLLLQFF